MNKNFKFPCLIGICLSHALQKRNFAFLNAVANGVKVCNQNCVSLLCLKKHSNVRREFVRRIYTFRYVVQYSYPGHKLGILA